MAAPRETGTSANTQTELMTPLPAAGVRVSEGRFTPGTVLAGRYQVVAQLGKGGMGEVYRADDRRLGQPVALKFLPAALAKHPDRLERLVDEVRIGRQVSHPNVCRLYDIVEADGDHFVVMEYVDGEDLASLLRRIGRLPADKALEIARDICAGLAAAHDKGVIHRDLKPANVMVDGRGHARIADFGLATLADRGPTGQVWGTPAYMAPEQFNGAPASPRSDVFALGLVLYEAFTGKRAYDGNSVEELRTQHADSAPPSMSSAARDIDPAVERVIHLCLARDPEQRPDSARAVLAALPGGDPLQAALLAGETPSPEMVAAAAKVGDLRPAVAWACLLSGLVGLLLVAWVTERTGLPRYVASSRSPEALVERARDVITRLGYGQPPVDSVHILDVDKEALEYVRGQDPSPSRWQRLASMRPGPLLLVHRQSPQQLVAASWTVTAPWEPPLLGSIDRDHPPFNLPGMTMAELDTQGRLVAFAAVPLRLDPASGPWHEVDWSVALAEAGLDPRNLRAAAPRSRAPVDTDQKAAWDGVNPDQPDMPVRVEAASYHGRPVYFEVQGPWWRPPNAGEDDPANVQAAGGVFLVMTAIIAVAIAVLVRRNLRRGRGDRRGALKVALLTSVAFTVGQLIRAEHTTSVLAEFNLITLILSLGCYVALLLWALYLALEPALRRRWPYALVSWSRLLAGRLSDPLVGRDALVGILGGIALILVLRVSILVPTWLGGAPLMPRVAGIPQFSDARLAVEIFPSSAALAPVYAMWSLFGFYILHSWVKRVWLAALLLTFPVWLGFTTAFEGVILGIPTGILKSIIAVVVLVRFGLLAQAVLFFTLMVLTVAPLTLDSSAWYGGRSFATLIFFAAALLGAAYVTLGGKPPFGRALVED
jgi:eukaryotic-like serine/threonine-protein kinase